MPQWDRGGMVLKTGKIGRVNCLRQQWCHPGERIRTHTTGRITLSSIREQVRARIHVRMDAFITPARWLWTELPDFIKEGPGTTKSIPKSTGSARSHAYGLGGEAEGSTQFFKPFIDNPTRIYNEYYKWPEDTDITAWSEDGPKAVNLETSWTRFQKYDGVADADVNVETASSTIGSTSREMLDLRDLAEKIGRYRNEMQNEWLAHDRYVRLLQEMFNAGGSREVDQVPIHIPGPVSHATPSEIWATDEDGLGAMAAVYDFEVNHRWPVFSLGEHYVLCYMLVIRFPPMADDECSPFNGVDDLTWETVIGNPAMLAQKRPENVKRRQFMDNLQSTAVGYLPAGWQWRTRWNAVGNRVADRNSFALIKDLINQNATNMRDASRVLNAFASQSLGDYLVEMNFDEQSQSAIPGPMNSLFVGS